MSQPKIKRRPPVSPPAGAACDASLRFAPSAAICAALLVATFAIYWPVRGFGFITYDDSDYIVNNWHVQTGLTWSNFRWAFTTGYLGNWLPLTWLSHMLDTELFGKSAGGPHLVNALIHAVNGALVFLLLRALTGAVWRSALVAALFALHPLRVESVAWACERRDVLSVCFGLLALFFYARFAQSRRRQAPFAARDYFLALAMFACSLMCKPMLVTLPFALLLLDYWPLGRIVLNGKFPVLVRRHAPLLIEKLPFFALTGFCSILTVKLQSAAGAVSYLGALPFIARAENAAVAYARYLGKIFWPTDLVLPYLRLGRWPPTVVVLSALLVISICVLALWLGRKHRFVAMGWFWFLGMLVPVIGLVQAGPQAMADRFVYLPALGVLVILVWALADWFTRLRLPAIVSIAGASLALVALTWRTADQLQYWRDSETLFQHTLKVEPDNYVAMNNLGVHYAAQGRDVEALEHYQRALQINPDHSQTWNNLGNTFAARQQYPDAIAAFQRSLQIVPGQPEAYVNLGSVYAAMGRTTDAIPQFETALKLRPDYPEACNNLGNTLALQGRFPESITILRRLIQLRPHDPDSHFNLANALALGGQFGAAVAEFQAALQLQPTHARALGNLGNALGLLGRWPDAVESHRLALRSAPADAAAHGNLGYALLQSGNVTEALTELQRALELEPDNVAANFHLGIALARVGRRDEAVTHLTRVLQLQPAHPEVRRTLRELGVPVSQ